jgi:hypothetical protein
MGWFKKKKEDKVEKEYIEDEYSDEGQVDEAEILRLLSEPDDFDEEELTGSENDVEIPFDDTDDFDEADFDRSNEITEDNVIDEKTETVNEIQITKQVSGYEELCDFVNSKPIGYIQYLRKGTCEVFQLRDAHLRIAKVWGSVSMNKSYSDKDYARIMLALEIIEDPDAFFVLPMFTDSEMQAAIMTFCLENFGINGKKYVKNTEKFAKLINENEMGAEWNEYTEELMKLKLERFCTKNGIFLKDEATEVN